MTKLAIIDIGTNSIHMVLAEVEPDFSYKILDRFKDMTRLGDGSFKSRRLSEAAMARGTQSSDRGFTGNVRETSVVLEANRENRRTQRHLSALRFPSQCLG